MIETQEPTEGKVVKQETPETITTTMIVNDLENGIDRTGIQEKYHLEAWEVKQMFMHPSLKGKKAKKVRKLSFTFVDDTEPTVDPNQTSIPVETTEKILEHADVETIDEVLELIDKTEEDDNEFEY